MLGALTRSPSRARGFSLTEVLVVILMIALLAVVASPAFVRMMRDVGLSRSAMQIAEVYRRAYVDSADRTTLLRWDGSDSAPALLEMRKSKLDDPKAPNALVPPHGCNAIAWNDPTRYERSHLNMRGSDAKEYASFTFLDASGNAKEKADVCFSQHRAYVRFDDGAFVAMSGVSRVRVKNSKSGAVRDVLVPSSGLARVWQ
ncbi:pilus assembly FimT family protein [Polyangium aurulentum]|uniref:pilus assembly FimT family protein n=1 Tax=Polyangium aurulentum TaxID=2567896 RepID=UPI00200FF383|nr:type II secretion system protein [Polyangium aurulentum]